MSKGIVGVSLVTGAANGIGRAVATRLRRTGYAVVLVDRDVESGERVAAELGSLAVFSRADVRSASEVQAAVDLALCRFRRLDVVVNNAGVNTYNDPLEMTEKDWEDAFAVDVKAAWLVARAALPHLIASGSAAIVNISSIHARLTISGMFPYAAAKAAIEGMTRSLAVEYGARGVRINAVAPRFTRTRLVTEWLQRQDDPAASEAAIDAAHPLGRIADPEEVASAVAFLVGPDASAITGAVIPVDWWPLCPLRHMTQAYFYAPIGLIELDGSATAPDSHRSRPSARRLDASQRYFATSRGRITFGSELVVTLAPLAPFLTPTEGVATGLTTLDATSLA